jgi:hypothetical protein
MPFEATSDFPVDRAGFPVLHDTVARKQIIATDEKFRDSLFIF